MLLFALALSLRLLFPAGTMPAQAQGLVVTICNGVGDDTQVVIDIPRSGGESEPGDRAQGEPCAFGSLSAAVLAFDAPVGIAGPAQPVAEIALPPPAAFGHGEPDHRSPPPRGPPVPA
jgi:hypothetical protein